MNASSCFLHIVVWTPASAIEIVRFKKLTFFILSVSNFHFKMPCELSKTSKLCQASWLVLGQGWLIHIPRPSLMHLFHFGVKSLNDGIDSNSKMPTQTLA